VQHRTVEFLDMTIEILLLLIIIILALILFSFERLPADVIALGLLFILVVTGLLPVETAFAGFGSDTFIMILGLLILTAALMNTGIVDLVSGHILNFAGKSDGKLHLLIMVVPATLSAFMSNTGATAFFLPIVMSLARKLKVPASRLLMPLAFATILASSVTLIGTSTNLVVSGLMVDYDLQPLGMFELSTVGLPILIIGVIYMLTVGKRWIPERPFDQQSAQDYTLHTYLTEFLILPESPMAGKKLADTSLSSKLGLTVLSLIRDKKRTLLPLPDTTLKPGDHLLVEGDRHKIINAQGEYGLKIRPEDTIESSELASEDIGLFEVIILPRSPLVGRTLRYGNFRQRYGLQVLGVHRSGQTLYTRLARLRLYTGDQLLVQGNRSNILALDQENAFRIIRTLDSEYLSSPLAQSSSFPKKRNQQRAIISVLNFLLVLLLSAFNILDLSVAVILGVLVAFISRTITPEEAYRQVEWRLLIMIGCMLGVGSAMEYTGTAAYLAGGIIQWTSGLDPIWLLSGFFMLTMLLTQPMSNQAAAAVTVPIAIQSAVQLGLNPRPFAIMIALGASCSFLTPLEPACLMVFHPGNYRFIDFLKVGTLLTILIYIITILLVPKIWPL
jgi:di/tricarboxylate transporter